MTRLTSIARYAVVAVAAALVGWSVAGWWKGADREEPGVGEAGPSKPKPISATSGSPLVATMAAVSAAGDPAAQMAAAVELASRLDPKDFPEFLENLRHLPAHSAQGLASRTVMRRWVAHDPKAALQWCVTRDPDLVDGVLDEWARNTPSDRLAEFLDQVPAGHRAQALPSAFNALAAHDPEAAMKLLDQPITEEFVALIDRPLRELAGRDPQWLLDRAASLPDHVQAQARKAVVQSMAESDAATAIAWAVAQPDRCNLLETLAERKDPDPTVLAAIAALRDEEKSGMFLPMYNWDPKKAPAMIDAIIAHHDQLGDSMLRTLLDSAGYYVARADDPGALANQLLTLETEAAFNVNGFASQWAQRSPEAARAWAASLDDENKRRETLAAIDKVADPPAAEAPERSAEKLALAINHGNRQQIHRLLAFNDADRHQALEAGFSQIFPPSDSISDGSSSSWREMAMRYPAEAAHWMAKTADFRDSDLWNRRFATTAAAWAADSPKAAADWAASLPAGEARAWAAANVIGQWKRFDEPAARAFLNSLPDAERAIASKGFARIPRAR